MPKPRNNEGRGVRLFVAEKPAVARDLARALGAHQRADGCLRGPRVWVAWCVGHVAELCAPHVYNDAWKAWREDVLPMLPEYFRLQPAARATDVFTTLRSLLCHRDVEEIVNACDAGREGELIFRYAYELSGCRKPVSRLWLRALTDAAIANALADLRPSSAFTGLADAARCRAEADWLVGLNATRALTLRQRRCGSDALWTVGRVQTPTLAMLAAREAEIEAFVAQPYWQTWAVLRAGDNAYRGLYTQDGKDRLPDAAAAQAVADSVRGQSGGVEKVDAKTQQTPPPPLFDLTALQRAANVRYGLSAATTLEAAQALYEKHKALTYPRTDSAHLTEDMRTVLPGVLRSLARPPYAEHVEPLLQGGVPHLGKRCINDDEVGDHHAIIPTGHAVDTSRLTIPERHVFDLVARRFVAVFLPAAVFALTTVNTRIGPHLFVSRGKMCTQIGWQAVEPPPSKQNDLLLPPLRPGQSVVASEAKVQRGETKAPPRYTEAMLLSAMERAGALLPAVELRRAMKDAGLGTPATRAATIEALVRRGFVRREGKILHPTSAGRALIGALPTETLKSPELTGRWEARLSDVARGALPRIDFMADVRRYVGQCVRDILARSVTPAGPCPTCKTGKLVFTHTGVSCSRWRLGCDYAAPLRP